MLRNSNLEFLSLQYYVVFMTSGATQDIVTVTRTVPVKRGL